MFSLDEIDQNGKMEVMPLKYILEQNYCIAGAKFLYFRKSWLNKTLNKCVCHVNISFSEEICVKYNTYVFSVSSLVTGKRHANFNFKSF